MVPEDRKIIVCFLDQAFLYSLHSFLLPKQYIGLQYYDLWRLVLKCGPQHIVSLLDVLTCLSSDVCRSVLVPQFYGRDRSIALTVSKHQNINRILLLILDSGNTFVPALDQVAPGFYKHIHDLGQTIKHQYQYNKKQHTSSKSPHISNPPADSPRHKRQR